MNEKISNSLIKPCNAVCGMLAEAGVPQDIKWRGMLGFLRDVGGIPGFSEKQKKMFHAILKRLIKKKDFSDASYNNMLPEILDIYALPYREEAGTVKRQMQQKEGQLSEERKLLQDMLNSYARLIEYGQTGIKEKISDIDNMKSATINAIEIFEDKAKMISEVTSAAAKVMDKMVKEAATWRHKAEETDQWKKKARDMEQVASIDKLTQVFTRRIFDEQLNELFKATGLSGKCLSLLMLDIDHFKRFNDTYGHQTGDGVLRAVAGIIKDVSVSKGGIPARYGGEEFAVIFDCISKEEAAATAEDIRARVERYAFPSGETVSKDISEGDVTISVGVAEALPEWRSEEIDNTLRIPEEETDPILYQLRTKLVNAADFALYQAKNTGRNKVFVY